MLESMKNEHYYAMRLEQIARDMELLAALKVKTLDCDQEDLSHMYSAIDCCKKMMVRDIEEIIQFLT